MPTDRVLILGDACVDLIVQLPDRARKPLDLTKSIPRLFGGGSGANVAVALSRLGIETAMVGTVGDDGYGRWITQDLLREGVATEGLSSINDAFTLMVMAIIEPDGERLIVVWPHEGAAHFHLQDHHIDQNLFMETSWLHTTGICLRASPARESILKAMKAAREAGLTVSLDLNLRLELQPLDGETRRTFEEAIDYSNVVFGQGDEEMIPLSGSNSIEEATRNLCNGQRIVIARKGGEGAMAVTPDGIHQIPAFNVKVVDTLGAGDAFNGGFIAAVLDKCTIEEATRWGNAVAAWNIGRPGARGLPTRQDLNGILDDVNG
jgi:sugar/nucleoside kinase (ribokinase family)